MAADASQHHDVDHTGQGAESQRRGRRRRRSERQEQPREIGMGLRSIGRVLGEASPDDPIEPARHVGPCLAHAGRRIAQRVGDEACAVGPGEGRPAGQQEVQGGARRVDVGPHVGQFSPQLLGRRERQRAFDAGAARSGRHLERRDRQPEVADLDLAPGVDEAVRRLHVAMHDTLARGRVEAGGDLTHQVHGFHRRQPPVTLDEVAQRTAGDQLGDDDRHAATLVGGEDVDDVGMADRRRQASFAKKARAVGLAVERASRRLDGDPSAAAEIHGFEDLAHASASEESEHPVMAEHLPVRQRQLTDGRRAVAVGILDGTERLCGPIEERGVPEVDPRFARAHPDDREADEACAETVRVESAAPARWTVSTMAPIRRRSPWAMGAAVVIRRDPIAVPFLLPRSSIVADVPVTVIDA